MKIMFYLLILDLCYIFSYQLYARMVLSIIPKIISIIMIILKQFDFHEIFQIQNCTICLLRPLILVLKKIMLTQIIQIIIIFFPNLNLFYFKCQYSILKTQTYHPIQHHRLFKVIIFFFIILNLCHKFPK